jgi:hypothetical protein
MLEQTQNASTMVSASTLLNGPAPLTVELVVSANALLC